MRAYSTTYRSSVKVKIGRRRSVLMDLRATIHQLDAREERSRDPSRVRVVARKLRTLLRGLPREAVQDPAASCKHLA